jgi:hypothetical protein
MTGFKIEHNVETGEILEIPLTEKETKEFQKLHSDSLKNQIASDAAATQKAADRAALLSQLGITEEQAKLLLG